MRFPASQALETGDNQNLPLNSLAPHEFPSRPVARGYLYWLALGLVASTASTTLVSLGDAAWASAVRDFTFTSFTHVALFAACFCAVPGMAVGLLQGIVLGALEASYPHSWRVWWVRLRDDRAFDQRATAMVIAALFWAMLVAGFCALVALRLVAHVERKWVGALLTGVLVAVSLPPLAFVALPVYRLFLAIAQRLPRLRLPTTVIVCAMVVAAPSLFLLWVVTTLLDWRALSLGPLFVLVLAVVIDVVLLLVLSKFSARTGSTRRHRAIVIAIPLASVLSLVALTSLPLTAGDLGLVENAQVVPLMLASARALSDRDGDGFSARFVGGDCDDDKDSVYPGAIDIPGNGVDENCIGGDALARSQTPAHRGAVAAPPPPESIWKGNVVVVVVDTFRADRLGFFGYRRDGKSLTPRLDKLAERSVVFDNVYAQAANTPRSFPSMFLSRPPSEIRWERGRHNYPRVLSENLSVFEVLRDAGMHTMGISSHFYFSEARGIRQGFVVYKNDGAKTISDSNRDVAAPRLLAQTQLALHSLGARKERFVLMVHLFEPHSAYVRHKQFPIRSAGMAALMERYDYEVAYVDGAVGTLMDQLAAHKLTDNTAIVVVSDHGEAFGEHRVGGKPAYFHGQALYEEFLKVPLLIAVPGYEHRRVKNRVMLLDLAPTLLALVGIAKPPPFRGRSLLGAMLGQRLVDRPVFAELLPAPSWNESATMMIDGDTKIMYSTTRNFTEVYDLKADALETKNIARAQPERTRALTERLVRWKEGLQLSASSATREK